MFNSSKVFAVAAGLVGAVLASKVDARGFSGGSGGSSHIRSSSFSASRGNSNFSQVAKFQKPVQLNAVKPVNTLSKLGNTQATNKLVNFAKGNQFSKGKNNIVNKFVANKGKNFKNEKYAKYFKSYCGYWPWGWCWNWGFGGYGGWNWGGYCGCGYDGSCGNYYTPWYTPGCYASPAVGTIAATDAVPADTAPTVTVVNPATNNAALSFAVAGQVYTLRAGESKEVDTTAGNEIQFDRGNGDTARYTLADGVYSFGATANGWELYRGTLTPGAAAPVSDPDNLASTTNE